MSLRLPRWIAHRGGGALAPENTLAGIRLAASMGYRAVEFDVMLSADGTPILIHDETLERTTNGRGRVAETPDRELFRLDAGQGEVIPRLAEALGLCAELGLLANVEIKPAPGLDLATAEAVCLDCAKHLAHDPSPLLISSFSLPALRVAQAALPAVPRGLLFERVPADWLHLWRDLAATTLHCAASEIANPQWPAWQAFGLPVVCYTVNCPDTAARLWKAGASACFTDALSDFSGETNAYKDLQVPG